MKKLLISLVRSILPCNNLGDKVYAFLCFIYFHKRLPDKNSNNLIDILYRVKIDGTLEEPLRKFISDKYYLKLYANAVLGEGFTVPTIALLDSKEQVESFCSEMECIVKPAHSSGDVIFLEKNKRIDFDAVSGWLNDDYYYFSREKNYKGLKRRIIVEPVLYGNRNINDYKFFFYNGKFLFVQIDVDRFGDHKRSFYSKDFEYLGFSTKYPLSPEQNMPENFNKMLVCAEKLAANFDSLIRIDLYTNGDDIRVGEITNCHGSGFESVVPDKKEIIIDEYL